MHFVRATNTNSILNAYIFQMPWQSTENLVDPIYLLRLLLTANGAPLLNQLIKIWNHQWIALMSLLGVFDVWLLICILQHYHSITQNFIFINTSAIIWIEFIRHQRLNDRIFQHYLKEFLNDLKFNHVLGRIIGYVCVIEASQLWDIESFKNFSYWKFSICFKTKDIVNSLKLADILGTNRN